MTNEEAIGMLKAKLECMTRDVSGCDDDCNRRLCGECHLNYEKGTMGEQKEYLRMSIKALEQEPCEDVISRQAVVDWLTDRTEKYDEKGHFISKELVKAEVKNWLAELPPVTPQPKIGRWIMPVQDDGMSEPIFYQVRCSECGFDLDPQTWHMELHQYGADKYCPNCGAKMEVEE